MGGRLIVIAGIDGSGKTVQTELLSARLHDNGYSVRTTSFPQYGKTFFAEMVTRYLHGDFGSLSDVSPYLAALLYAGDRWQAKEEIRTWLNEGKIVVSNRYVADNEAHQGGKLKDPGEREKFLHWLDKLEYEVFGLPRADINLYLHVPVGSARRLIKKKPERDYLAGGKKDIHEENAEYLAQTQEVYLKTATSANDWAVIECTSEEGGGLLTPGEISDKVWAVVDERLLKR